MGVPEVAELLRVLLTIATCCWIARIRTSYNDKHFDKLLGRALDSALCRAANRASWPEKVYGCRCVVYGMGVPEVAELLRVLLRTSYNEIYVGQHKKAAAAQLA